MAETNRFDDYILRKVDCICPTGIHPGQIDCNNKRINLLKVAKRLSNHKKYLESLDSIQNTRVSFYVNELNHKSYNEFFSDSVYEKLSTIDNLRFPNGPEIKIRYLLNQIQERQMSQGVYEFLEKTSVENIKWRFLANPNYNIEDEVFGGEEIK
ncbi:MAG: hypothetical protein WCX73_00895 [Candidatus Pacearchaeota archaeon]|jgi:hypothetical protein